MSLGINIQRAFRETEKTLTKFSARPLIGSPFGVVRVILGAGQLSMALITGILAGISVAAFKCNKNILDHSIVHIKHGFKNIILGVIGTIPLVQMILAYDYLNPLKCNGYYHAKENDAENLQIDLFSANPIDLAHTQDSTINKEKEIVIKSKMSELKELMSATPGDDYMKTVREKRLLTINNILQHEEIAANLEVTQWLNIRKLAREIKNLLKELPSSDTSIYLELTNEFKYGEEEIVWYT